MAFSASTRHLLLLVSTMICIFVSTCKFGSAYDDHHPGAFDDHHLGAAGVVANEYVPAAEAEGEGEGEGEGETDDDEYYHEPEPSGVVGAKPGPEFTKALECFHDKYIYSSCEEDYRLTEKGELHVPPEYTDQYCKGPCLKETHLVLECIEEILKHFEFYNKATVKDIKETIKDACGFGPKRGNFDVVEHIKADEGIASKMSSASVFYAVVLMIMSWHVLF